MASRDQTDAADDMAVSRVGAAPLNESARYRGLFAQMREGLLVAELITVGDDEVDFRYVDANPAAERILGMSRDRIVGRTAREIIPNPQEDLLALCAEVVRTGTPREREVFEPLVSQYHHSYFYRPAEGQVAVLFSDVTEYRRSAFRLQTLIASIDDHLAVYDREWRFTFLNEAAARTLGFARESLLGKCIWDVFPNAVGNEYYRALHQAAAEQRVIHQEHYYPPFDRWFENHIYPSDDGVTVFSTDITARKRVEAALRASEDALREADRRKDEFLAMLAHELRNPLAAIRNAVEILVRTNGEPGATRVATGILDRQVRHMIRQVDDLLDVSRISRGTIELRLEDVDLVAVARDAIEAIRIPDREGEREFSARLPDKPLLMRGDAVRLTQAIGNLLNNAFKFTDVGGRIALSLAPDANEAVLRVQDNGIGMAADQLERVFEMFAQVDTSLERTRDGLGLGLTLVKRIVEMHGGTVAATSEGVGKGCEFVVRLPSAMPRS